MKQLRQSFMVFDDKDIVIRVYIDRVLEFHALRASISMLHDTYYT